MSRLLGLAVLVLGMLVLAGCGGKETVTVTVERGAPPPTQTTEATPEQDPGDFMKELVQAEWLGQWGRVWGWLHPEQQALISSSDFDTCKDRETADDPSQLTKVEVLDVYDDPIQLAHEGVPQKTSKAVTVRTTYTTPATGKRQITQTDTAHAIAV